jgi:hypothetical protein
MSLEDKLAIDMAVYGQEIIRQITLRTFRERFWGAWKVIIGEAGIIMVRVNPKKVFIKARKEE